MITKEERAELRELVGAANGEWRVLAPGELVFANDVTNWVGSTERQEDTVLVIAAVNAMPVLLDALDAADERIAGLEALRDAHRDARERADAREDALKSRIAELEAAAQWRTMDTAPRDGTRVLIASKEERAELRERLREVGVVVGGEWRAASGCESNWVRNEDGDPYAVAIDPDDEHLAVAVVNAAPRLLDALDASDERIAELETTASEQAELWKLREKEHELAVRMVTRRNTELKEAKARIAELEAAAQWRTMDTAPRDGTKVLIASLTNQYLPPRVFAFRDRWVSQSVELTDKQAKEHNAVWLPIPALPEGGA